MKWRTEPPQLAEMNGQTEQYYWARGANFNRPIMVRANHGVTSAPDPTPDNPRNRRYWDEVNIQLYADNYPEHIWLGQLAAFHLDRLEWAGPVPRPEDDQ